MNIFDNMVAEQLDMVSPTSQLVPEVPELFPKFGSSDNFKADKFPELSKASNKSSEAPGFSVIPEESEHYETSETCEEVLPEPKLIPGILVMNRKYFIDLKNEAPKNGDIAFAMAIIQVLQKADAFLGMILYEKSEQRVPKVTYTVINNVNCAVIPHNPNMYTGLLNDAITKACNHLAKLADSTTDTDCPVAIIYHQDERLLEAQPRKIPFAITHHSPFVADVSQHYPDEGDLLDAFGGDLKSWHKVKNLIDLQDTGLEQLRNRPNGFVLAMSDIQANHAHRSGVKSQNILTFPPPLHKMLSAHELKPSTEPLLGVHRKYFIFTAVARLTWFKNIELLIDGTVLLLEQGLDISLLIAGGDDSPAHNNIRATLLGRVPARFLTRVHVTKRLPQEELHAYFANERVQSTGIFVCSSRYETLGITPLESALSGLTTVISDTDLIEASKHYPEAYRFQEDPKAMADCLERLLERDLKDMGQDLKGFIEVMINDMGDFESEFLDNWTMISALFL